MLELLKRRRSVRKFTQVQLTQEEKDSLLKAGLMAPSSAGKYPIELIAIENKETIEQFKACKNVGNAPFESGTFAVVVIGDNEKSDVCIEDGSIAATQMFLQAEAMDIGCTWVQMRNRTSGTEDSEVAVRKLLGIPEKYLVLAILVFGNKGEEKKPYTEDNYKFEKIHREKF